MYLESVNYKKDLEKNSPSTGSALSEGFFNDLVLPLLESCFHDCTHSISAAAVGEGSDVLGFDDSISRDHNFGPRVSIFLPDDIHSHIAQDMLNRLKTGLPDSYFGVPLLWSQWAPAVRVLPLLTFHRQELELPELPSRDLDWLRCNEQKLQELTAGRVFHDPEGQLLALRQKLAFYPPGVRLFLLRLCFFRMSETAGVERSIRRHDRIATNFYLSFFTYFAIRALHLLAGRYCPYFKWMAHSLRRIGPKEADLADRLEQLSPDGSLTSIREGMLEILFDMGTRITQELSASPVGKHTETLELLDFDWNAVIKPLSEALPPDLAGLSPLVSPPGYIGLVFDYRGYEASFRTFLKRNVEHFDNRHIQDDSAKQK